MIFRQKGPWWSRREFIIEHDGVKVIVRALSGSSKEFFDFHHIGKVIIRKRKRGWFSLMLALLFLSYGIWLLIDVYNSGDQITMAAGCIFLALLLSLLFPGQRHLHLLNEKDAVSIKFLDNTPSKEELDTFIMHIKKAQRIRLQQLYMTIDENMSYDEYRNKIQWLWDNEFLSQKEAEQRLGVVISAFF